MIAGSCWAFASVAAIEGVHKISKGRLISLSEQELLDCDFTNFGCGGGYPQRAFSWVASNGGITTEANYPYRTFRFACDFLKLGQNAASIRSYQNVPPNDERSLTKAVARQPVTVCVDAGSLSFQLYTGGIYDGPCGINLNHAVTAVGYGTDRNGINYWILKNSWGITWGDQGYMYMKKDVAKREGTCGIAMDASYPTIWVLVWKERDIYK